MYLIIIMLAVVLIDRITKLIVINNMAENSSIPIIDNVLHLTYILNPGAAFGMLEHNRTFFIGLTVFILVLAVVLWSRVRQEAPMVQYGMALFLGGAIGNVIDRIKTGLVIDFIDFRIWPIFNVADMAICLGVGLIIWSVLTEEKKTEK